jgi:hypothetical protein
VCRSSATAAQRVLNKSMFSEKNKIEIVAQQCNCSAAVRSLQL